MFRSYYFLAVSYLLTFISTSTTQAQVKKDYVYYVNHEYGALCGSSVLVFKDSSYCFEGGCENSSSFSFGKWTQKKNTITFHPVQPTTYKVISKVERSSTNDKTLTVIIYDNKGNNITERVIATQFKENVGYYKMELDSAATKRSDVRRPNTTIILQSLQKLLKQKVEIITDSSNVYKIYLNISGDWNFQTNSVWNNGTAFSATKTKTELICLPPNGEIKYGEFKGTEYIRQEN